MRFWCVPHVAVREAKTRGGLGAHQLVYAKRKPEGRGDLKTSFLPTRMRYAATTLISCSREEPDGTEKYVIVEVKADNQVDDVVVQAKKEFADQLAVASGMEYRLIKATDANQRRYRLLM